MALAVWGGVLLTHPSDSTQTLARLLGVGLVLLGVSLFARWQVTSGSALDRVNALVWVAVGVAGLVWPQPTVRGLAILCGLALVGTGVAEVWSALRPANDDRLLVALGGVTSVALGIAVLAWPSLTVLLLSVIVGVRLLVGAAAWAAYLLSGRDRPAAPRRSWVRWAATIGALVVGLVAAFVSVSVHRAQPSEPGPFYATPNPLPGGPGTHIRDEVVDGFVDGATTYRVLYVTSDHRGQPTTSSGLVIVPDGEAPAGGRPVMAWTHGTIGIARRCAPSLLPGDVYAPLIPGLAGFLEAGFVVVATDYAGLGSEAVKGYLVGAESAYSTLDSVRAAISMPETGAGPEFVVFGESQGGHAALFSGQYAAAYAPELDLKGVAAAAPATDLQNLFKENVGTTFGDVLASYALVSWRDVYGIDLEDIVYPDAIPVIERIGSLCLGSQKQMVSLLPEAELLRIRFLSGEPWSTERWATIIGENTPGGSIVDAPVLVAQGADDPLVLPSVQSAFVEGWCASGQSIEYRTYPGVGHLDSGQAVAPDVTAWAMARFSGQPWTPTCG